MKQMLTVRSNPYYTQQEEGSEFLLKSHLEIVIIHTDGKDHKLTKKGIESFPNLTETRLLVSPELLQDLITDLQLHQKKLEGFRKNADQINSLIKHITTSEAPSQ
jgi:hypothetical protein